jgi:HAD superfamily hydrolase (TIGR01509 family)
MFEAVIFDWDGTLADTKRVVVASFQKALKENQYNIDNGFIERRIGIGSAETFREILRQLNVQFDETLISSLVKRKIEAEIEMTYDVKLLEGALNLLKSLRGKVKLGLASMNNRRVIDHLLDAMDICRFFDAVLTAEDIICSKPNPEIFLKCARKLNSKPSKSVVIEDSIFGVKAAKNAGMCCVAVLTGFYRREELNAARPDLIVNSLKQSREILDFILE